MAQETFRPAFTDPPGDVIAGIPVAALKLKLLVPHVSYGLPYYDACAKHVSETFSAKKPYIIASGTLSRESDRVDRLVEALNSLDGVRVVGVRKGMTPHTPWSQILAIAGEFRSSGADCMVTLGAGSITDGAKIVVLAS